VKQRSSKPFAVEGNTVRAVAISTGRARCSVTLYATAEPDTPIVMDDVNLAREKERVALVERVPEPMRDDAARVLIELAADVERGRVEDPAGDPPKSKGRVVGSIAGRTDEEVAEEVLARYNVHHAIIRGERPVVLVEDVDADGTPCFQLMTTNGFREWYRHDWVIFNKKERPAAELWLSLARARRYKGLAFLPGSRDTDYYNLWRGWAVEPNASSSCQKLLDHVLDNVCNGSERTYEFVMGWFAHMVQFPDEKTGTSLALRGPQGVGKTMLGKAVGSVLGPHYTLVSHDRFVTGRFNSHMHSCLLLHADEAFWAGDKSAEGKIKDLVTGDWHLIEYKGREPQKVRNILRLLVTSEQERIVPAALKERRFAVFDVAQHQMQDHAYFAAIEEELQNGGRGALLHYLQHFDISNVDLRRIPETAALRDQKLASMESDRTWLLNLLREGVLPGDTDAAGEVAIERYYAGYVEHAKNISNQHRLSVEEVGRRLRAIVPGTKRVREPRKLLADGSESKRRWMYRFPPLAESRAAFNDSMKSTEQWEEDVIAEWQADHQPTGGALWS
jgi:hypothetical protein